ncbi:hypothetical protein 2AV2_14 [Nodularia phage vB_NpeS-2AV2]|jgi:hypothetical protein|uniref:Uncharacterized protein n=3 Tax=Ravarandavirus TaxID=2843444 RepID=A0A482MJV8_9CAUD|nr:hypothetical protein HWA92_gp014 [Nodularia phage vB_NpeS-2AV2]YP_009844829.1 hypothetical protein HWC13_gp020 [Nodularia phage vB_NspS-kac68v161]ALY07466.1 hypothetical protein 2AV2_14 [Nodularia phage vB_NpeS-2AV2]QBQ73670.1 hypothetical protein kac68v161_gp020 [Nodularia phage vB_NspS-kac68v161]QBQ73868.1 hypothetical protein kac68v162_gp020 [Nodularia phage vB_NspS-kac68v162]
MNEYVKKFLEECHADGEPLSKIPFLLQGFVKALAAIQDSGELYRNSQDPEWLQEQIKESGLKFKDK